MLVLDDISKGFVQPGAGRLTVLDRIGFTLERKSTAAVVGQSGSGKTTLLSLIAGLDKPDTGEILLDGEDLVPMGQDRLARYRARKIGIIFQQFHLMPHLTAMENISLPLEIQKADNIQARTREMLGKVGLEHRSHHLPSQLSGGECQRVAIARALVVRPSLLLADEPTGNLDIATGQRISSLLFDLVRDEDTGLVVVTHNPELAGQCHARFTLDRGRLVF
jgi:putative ABC transport system ATP-binding protein